MVKQIQQTTRKKAVEQLVKCLIYNNLAK
uniref:Uncharacterized protein n=1 Tax=Arundo donax TaxID=35708 RepID=A0A0A8YXR7_ARUDO